MNLGDLTNDELLSGVERLLGSQRRLTALLLRHLAEVEERRLHLLAACSSMFDFCMSRLGMSEGEAYRRVTGSRVARRFPVVLPLIESGKLHLSALCVLSKHTTQQNHLELFRDACGKSKREVEALVAARFPKPDVPSWIRKLPERASSSVRVVSMALPLAAAGGRLGAGCASGGTLKKIAAAGEAQGEVAAAGKTHGTVTPAVEPQGTVAAAGRAQGSVTAAGEAQGTVAAAGEAQGTVAAAGEGGGAVAAAGEPHATGVAAGEDQGIGSAGEETRAPFALGSSELNGTVRATRRFGAAAPCRIEPLSAARYKVQFTAGAELKAKLERARNLLSHAHPSRDLALIVEQGIDLLLAELERTRLGKLKRARATRLDRSEGSSTMGKPETSARTKGRPEMTKPEVAAPTKKSRAIPRAARREVFERDGERCSFVDGAGRRCPARAYLEIDHIRANALGGGNENENLRVYCRAHNRLLAELTFGREHVAESIDFRQRRQRKCRGAPQAELKHAGALDAVATTTAMPRRS